MKLSLRALKHLFSFIQSSLDCYRKRSTSITELDMSLRQQLSTLEKNAADTGVGRNQGQGETYT